METESAKDQVSRRGFLGVSSAALAAAVGVLTVGGASGQEQTAGSSGGGDRSRSDPGPANGVSDAQNADSTWPPATDSKSLVPTFKYPFSMANKRAYKGGWSREVTVRELPVSKSLAGVNMRLTAGGVRELHWHTAGEWAIMLYGSARITAIDLDGKSFVADTNKYDLWFFPGGVPHSIQGLEPDGCEFMLVFDDGNFSESETVLLSDSISHIPPEVLAKNFGVSEQALKNVPRQELFIFQAPIPASLETDRKVAAGALGKSSRDFSFRTMDFQAGDVGYVEKTLLHYIENTGDTDLIFLEMFKSSFYQDLSLSEWLTHTPPELVMAHLNIDRATLDAIPKDSFVIVPA